MIFDNFYDIHIIDDDFIELEEEPDYNYFNNYAYYIIEHNIYKAAVELIDDDIREKVQMEVCYGTVNNDFDFLTKYMYYHFLKYKEYFQVN